MEEKFCRMNKMHYIGAYDSGKLIRIILYQSPNKRLNAKYLPFYMNYKILKWVPIQ